MGRFKHEGANVIVNRDGRVVAYMGDDERFDYVYRFVSRDQVRHGGSRRDRAHNRSLLPSGDLSVARFTGDGLADGVSDGTGEWIPLTVNGQSVVPGFTTRARYWSTPGSRPTRSQPTKMDRPEDVEPNHVNGFIYVACTNNTDRGKVGKEGPTEPNPRNANKDGHVVEISRPAATTPARPSPGTSSRSAATPPAAGTYFGGYDGPVSPISCPDNVAFDSAGNLWVSTDGQPCVDRPQSTVCSRCRSPGPSAAVCSSSWPCRPRPRPAARSSTTRTARCSSPCSTRARTAPGRHRHRTSPTTFPPPALRLRGDFAGPRPTIVQVTRG